MPLRRCPHCKGLCNFEVGNPVAIPQSKEVVRFDRCQNCHMPTYFRYPSNEPTAVPVDMYPKLEGEPGEELPEGVRLAFQEALKSLNQGVWNGCLIMCRRALQEAMEDLGAKGDTLFDQIDSLEANQGITPALKEWAHQGRFGANLGGHGSEQEKWADRTDAEEIVEFCRWFFRYVYVLPKQLEDRRQRLSQESSS